MEQSQDAPVHATYVPVAEQTRGPIVESLHYGAMATTDKDGQLSFSLGDPNNLIYPRSALKPLQTVAMVRAGLHLPLNLLALATASHSGSEIHRNGASEILSLHGLTASALENTTDLPYGLPEREDWLRAGRGATQLAQNCSGKHAAMLATCMVNDWPLHGYSDPGHPLQQAIRRVVEELTEETIQKETVDGCGTPLFALRLSSMARAFSTIASSGPGTAENTVTTAIRSYPEYLAGEGRDVTALIRLVPGLITKDGAEGIQLVGLEDGRAIAIKISDGSDRARISVTIAALAHLGISSSALTELAHTPIFGGGKVVGSVRAIALQREALVTTHG